MNVNIINAIELLLDDLEQKNNSLNLSAAIDDISIKVKDGRVLFDLNIHAEMDRSALDHFINQINNSKQ